MDKQKIIKETKEFIRRNIPESRKPKEDYFKHVFGVRKYGLKLAKIYGADKFIIEMASLLHDVGADAGKEHAEESAKISKKFLKKLDIPEEIKERILQCIKLHSMGSKTENIEEQIIQDADGIIFIEDTYKSFFEGEREKLPLEEAKEISIEKTKGMMDKIKTKEGVRLAKKFLATTIKCLKSKT